jgi:hypothetical protein
MPACLVCGKQTDLLIGTRGQYVCSAHAMLVRNEFAYGLRHESFRPYHQELVDKTPEVKIVEHVKGTKKAMAATNKRDAQVEGKEFARLLGALVVKQSNPGFEAVSDFATYYAQSVIGYSDAERANGWTKGFIAQWIDAQASDPDALNVNTVELLRKALGLPPLLEAKNGE